MGIGRSADQRNMAAGASQQGDRDHAVWLGDWLHRRGGDGRPGTRGTWQRPRDMAVAVCRRRRACAVHAVDSTQRTGTRNLEDAWSDITRRKPVQSDFWTTSDWPNAADHSARHGGAI